MPDRILRAMSLPTIDHRGPEFAVLAFKVIVDMQKIFQTQHPVMIYPASGTGAWEAALVNTLSVGDHVLMYETGQFATLWNKLATRLGIKTEFIGMPGLEGWRHGIQADLIEARLKADTTHTIKAVCVVHNETSTGVTSDIPLCDVRWTTPSILHCCWWIPFLDWQQLTIAMMHGVWTSLSAAHKKGSCCHRVWALTHYRPKRLRSVKIYDA